MILITGARGFIGSNLVHIINKKGIENLILVDELIDSSKDINLAGKKYHEILDRDSLWNNIDQYKIDFVFHIGARTDTTEFSEAVFNELNFHYSQKIWNYCTKNQIPLIYASSAATYGDGSYGYDDRVSIDDLKPLNPYGWSKQNFDIWVTQQKECPPFWAGLKFFNVYGPFEYHKGRMASVIFHAYHQIKESGKVKLFKSHRSDYEDGGQLRDFIYVKDILKIMFYLFINRPKNGIYNCGTGKARTFKDLAKATFKALNKEVHIEFVDTPEDIRDKYQYFTEAKMHKLIESGYDTSMYSLEDGVQDYVVNYLEKQFGSKNSMNEI